MKRLDVNISKVLIVDDNVQNFILFKTMLEHMNLNFFIAMNGNDALKSIDENDFDIILIETILPDIHGYDICRKIKSNEKTADIPVLLISSFSSNEEKANGFKSGADDYLIKPLSKNEISSRVQLHLHKQKSLKHMKQLLKRSYHELYNPLAVIKSSVEMFEIHNEQNKYVQAIHAAEKSLHVIYEDLYYSLSLTKNLESKERINLNEYLIERVDFFSLLAEIKMTEFILNLHYNVEVNMSKTELQRVLDNTLSNAIKYAYVNTKIIITTIYNDGLLELSILNQGNNIKSPEKIFSGGYRENYEINGMGIGLEIVASICDKYNIQTMVYSKDNITTFTYIFPKDEA